MQLAEFVGLYRRTGQVGGSRLPCGQHLAQAAHVQRAAKAVGAGRRIQAHLALEREAQAVRVGVGRLGQEDVQRLRIDREHAARKALARCVPAHKCVVVGLAVARMRAHLRAGREHQAVRQRLADRGVGHAQVAGRDIRAIAHAGHACEADAVARADLHAEGAGQQRIGRGHQGVGAGRQARHAGRNGHLLPHCRCAETRLGRHGRIAGRAAGHDGVHAAAAVAVGIEGVRVRERRGQHVDRAAASGGEARARQRAAARQVEQ